MKLLFAAIAIAAASPAAAQDPHAGHAGHHAAAPAAAGPAATAARLTLDTPLGELLADPAAKAVVDGVLPGLDQHPAYEMAKGMSLRQIQPYAEGAITDEHLARIEAGLAAIR